MSNLVMPIGGIGAQNSVTDPVVVDKEDWQTYGPSAFMASDGGHLVYYDAAEIDYSGSNPVVLGDFSALTPIVNTAGATIYAFLSNIIQDGLPETSGYFKILSASSTGLEIEATALDGFTMTEPSSTPGFDVSYIRVGGAGPSIELADLYIGEYIVTASNDTLEHNVDVLTNLNETLTADTTLSADSGAGKIRFLGKRHAAGYEFADCQNKSQYPVIDGDYAITFSGDGVEVSDIKFSSNRSSRSIITMSGNNSILNRNWIIATNSATHYAVYLRNGATAINNYIDCPAHSMSVAAFSALYLYNYNAAYGNFITCDGRGMSLRVSTSRICFVSNNIILNPYQLVSDTIGISTNSLSNNGGLFCTNNIIAGFTKGINLGSLAAYNGRNLIFYNNIIWGQGTGSYGIYDAASNAAGVVALCNHFIGNCETKHNLSYDLDFHELTANPFKNASGNLNKPSDFYINDETGGGALIKANYQPTDYDLDGTRDNYQYGPIMEEVTSGGGGGVSASRIFGGL